MDINLLKHIKEETDSVFKPMSKEEIVSNRSEDAELGVLCHIYIPRWPKTLGKNTLDEAQEEAYRIITESLPQGWILNIYEVKDTGANY